MYQRLMILAFGPASRLSCSQAARPILVAKELNATDTFAGVGPSSALASRPCNSWVQVFGPPHALALSLPVQDC